MQQNLKYYLTSTDICSPFKSPRKQQLGCFGRGMACATNIVFWLKLSDLTFKIYRGLNFIKKCLKQLNKQTNGQLDSLKTPV